MTGENPASCQQPYLHKWHSLAVGFPEVSGQQANDTCCLRFSRFVSWPALVADGPQREAHVASGCPSGHTQSGVLFAGLPWLIGLVCGNGD